MTNLSRAFQNSSKISISILLPLLAALIWLTSLRSLDLRSMNDLGLISIMPTIGFFALGLLTVSFFLTLHREEFGPVIPLLQVALLIFMLYGAAPLVEGSPRTPISWKLMGIIDHVMYTGTVDPTKDAFQNWPGFFILIAFLARIAGLEDPRFLATWAPVFFNLLYLAPLYWMYRAATRDQRLIWLGIWLFYLSNWIGQDYLAPQALSFFWYMVILAVLIHWFKQTPVQPPAFFERWFSGIFRWRLVRFTNTAVNQRMLLDRRSTTAQRIGLIAIIVFIFAAIVPSHQLTPFAILITVAGLVLFKRLTLRSLPVLMLVLTATWISYMATAYVTGHSETITSPVGAIGENLNANLADRFRGSDEHIFILQIRLFFSWFFWMLAALGIVRRYLHGKLERTFLILAGAPFLLLGLQAYGGELLMRVYFFSLPFMAFFGAGLVYPEHDAGRSPWNTAAAIAVSIALIVGFFYTRYGNERIDYFTPQEVAAVEHLYEIVPPDAQILVATQTLPWRFEDYNEYRYGSIEPMVRRADIDRLVDTMKDRKYSTSYLILTRSMRTSARLYIGWPPGTWERFETALQESGKFIEIYSNQDARILMLDPKQIEYEEGDANR